MASSPTKLLERFDNPKPERDYEITLECPEFTCLCPLTGQPDFAKIRVRYVADKYCVELKSFKNYLWSYRNEGAFHEKVTNTICDDLVAVLGPRFLEVEADFLVRGGIRTIVKAHYIHGEDDPIELLTDVGERTE